MKRNRQGQGQQLASSSPSVRICCRWRLKVTRLWCWWYACFATSGQAYLVYRAISKCRSYNRSQWQSDLTDVRKPVAELYALIALTVFAVMTLPFFVVATCFRLGNLPADGARLGFQNSPSRSVTISGTIWKYSAPLGVSLHLVASILLLLPGVFLEAREIQHNLKSRAYLQSSELDFVYRHYVAPGYNKTLADEIGIKITPELINYLFATLIYSVQYPSVFWYTNIAYSVMFSCLLIFIGCHSIVTFCGMSVIYKLRVNRIQLESEYLPVLPELAVMLLYLAAEGVIFIGAMSLFNYGLRQFRIASGSRSVEPLTTGYVPHTMAVTCLTIASILRAPIFYDSVICYRATSGNALLGSSLADVILLITWVVVWMTITLKQKWKFRLRKCQCAPNSKRHNKPHVTFEPTTPAPEFTTPRITYNSNSAANDEDENVRMEGGNGLFRLHRDHNDGGGGVGDERRYRNDLRSYCDNFYRSAFSPLPVIPPRSRSSADVYEGRSLPPLLFSSNRKRPLSTGFLQPRALPYPVVTFPEEPWQYDTTSLDSNDVLCSRV